MEKKTPAQPFDFAQIGQQGTASPYVFAKYRKTVPGKILSACELYVKYDEIRTKNLGWDF